jgi:hypothetical protein
MKKDKNKGFELVKSVHPSKPNMNYFLPKEDKKLIQELIRPQEFTKGCQAVCTKTITLLPKMSIDGGRGVGYFLVNVDGYRYVNVYIISSALFNSNQKGFSLDISFSVNPFVYGVGVVGEASYFFNFDNYYNITDFEKKIIYMGTDYRRADNNGLPYIGGVDLTHMLRIPVMGPYIRASAFNNDDTSHDVEVLGYLTT